MQKKGLGKGLSAIISGASRRRDGTVTGPPQGDGEVVEQAASEQVIRVPLSEIDPSPMQPRKSFRDEHIQELLLSIQEHGVIQPLIVRRVNGRYELIAGERRFRASQKAGLMDAPVIVREASDREVLELALIENLQREDLNPVEEAEAYARLSKEFGMRQEDIAQRVGKNRATVANSLRLLDLAADVKTLLAQGMITTGHAKAILSLKDHALQSLVADMVVRQGLTVRETEKQVAREMQQKDPSPNGEHPAKHKPTMDVHVAKIQSKLRDKFATHVVMHHGEKKGRIEIEYYGNDDLSRILDLLGVRAE